MAFQGLEVRVNRRKFEQGEGEVYFLGGIFILCCLISGAIACLGAIKDYKNDKMERRDEQRFEQSRLHVQEDDHHAPEGYSVEVQ